MSPDPLVPTISDSSEKPGATDATRACRPVRQTAPAMTAPLSACRRSTSHACGHRQHDASRSSASSARRAKSPL